MADGIHAVVQRIQALGGEHALDLVRAEPEREQLSASDHAMLRGRPHRERLLAITRSRNCRAERGLFASRSPCGRCSRGRCQQRARGSPETAQVVRRNCGSARQGLIGRRERLVELRVTAAQVDRAAVAEGQAAKAVSLRLVQDVALRQRPHELCEHRLLRGVEHRRRSALAAERARELLLRHRRAARDVGLLRAFVQLVARQLLEALVAAVRRPALRGRALREPLFDLPLCSSSSVLRSAAIRSGVADGSSCWRGALIVWPFSFLRTIASSRLR